jgi:hypothetical protein
MNDLELISRFGVSEGQIGVFSFGLYLSYALTVIALIGATLIPVLNAIRLSDTKSLIKLGASVGVMLVLFFVCRAVSADEVLRLCKLRSRCFYVKIYWRRNSHDLHFYDCNNVRRCLHRSNKSF